jgi:hypothetical protein
MLTIKKNLFVLNMLNTPYSNNQFSSLKIKVLKKYINIKYLDTPYWTTQSLTMTIFSNCQQVPDPLSVSGPKDCSAMLKGHISIFNCWSMLHYTRFLHILRKIHFDPWNLWSIYMSKNILRIRFFLASCNSV